MATPEIFNSLTSLDATAFRAVEVSHENELTTDLNIVSFLKPNDILVSKWYPGYRVSDLSGRFADEAIGILLADTLRSVEALSTFQKLLATPDIATEVFTTLLPRAGVPVKNRKYLMSEETIASVVREKLASRGADDVPSRVAYTHACTRVMAGLGLVQPGIERQSVNLATSYAITVQDIKRVVLTEALRDLMSEARLNVVAKELNEESTPQIIGETVGRMFRNISHVMPEIKLRLEQLEDAIDLVTLYHVSRDRVPNALQAHPALVQLASYANFVYYAEGRVPNPDLMPTQDIASLKEACNNILTVIQSAPSIESMPLKTYAEFFGEVPAASPDGLRRGLVLFTSPSQTSRMDVADCHPNANGAEISAVAGEYVKVTAVAPAITSSILSVDAATGLANLMADELAMTAALEDEETCFVNPSLLMMNVSEEDVVYLALAKAEAVAFVQDGGRGPVRLIYGCTVAEQWRMTVFAASPAMAYFTDPHAVIVYRSPMRLVEPRPLSSRNQTIGIVPGRDIQFIGNMEQFLVTGVEKPFMLKMPVQTYGDKEIVLDLSISVLSTLIGEDSEGHFRGGAYYAAIREPGVDTFIQNMLDAALCYARDGGNILGDKAKSWLIERLAPAMLHPAIQTMAQRAINRSVVRQQLDARALAPQFKEIVVRSYIGTLLAVLTRFEKVRASTAVGLTSVLPVSGLSIRSQLTMANVPTALNAKFE